MTKRKKIKKENLCAKCGGENYEHLSNLCFICRQKIYGRIEGY